MALLLFSKVLDFLEKIKKVQAKDVVFGFMIPVFGPLIIAIISYPENLHYSILSHPISDLGLPDSSPGWIFFELSMFLMAISGIWISLINFRNINENYHIIKGGKNTLAENEKVYYFWNILGAIIYCSVNSLLIIVAAVPNINNKFLIGNITYHIVHFWAAAIMFMIWPIGLLSYGMIYNFNKRVFLFPFWPAAITYIPSILLLFITQLIRLNLGIYAYEPGILSYSLWEWTVFFTSIFVFDYTAISLNFANNKYKKRKMKMKTEKED